MKMFKLLCISAVLTACASTERVALVPEFNFSTSSSMAKITLHNQHSKTLRIIENDIGKEGTFKPHISIRIMTESGRMFANRFTKGSRGFWNPRMAEESEINFGVDKIPYRKVYPDDIFVHEIDLKAISKGLMKDTSDTMCLYQLRSWVHTRETKKVSGHVYKESEWTEILCEQLLD